MRAAKTSPTPDHNDTTCTGEMSKGFRLAGWARTAVEEPGIDTRLPDPSVFTPDYGRTMHACACFEGAA